MRAFTEPLQELEEFQKIQQALKKQSIQVTGCIDAQKAHFIYAAGAAKKKLIVTYSELRAKELCENYRLFDKNVLFYPAKDLIFYSADVQSNLLVQQRIRVLQKLMEEEEVTIVTTMGGIMDHLLPPEVFQKQVETVESDSEFDMELWKKKLTAMGYERVGQVEGSGQFAVRGGILDIFPLTEENPVRIELWGDEIDSIRSFDVESQRSIENLDRIRIYPAGEFIADDGRIKKGLAVLEKEAKRLADQFFQERKTEESARLKAFAEEVKQSLTQWKQMSVLDGLAPYFYDRMVSFAEYFPKEALVVLDEPNRLWEEAQAIEKEFRESMTNRLEKGYVLPGQMNILYSGEQVAATLEKNAVVTLATMETKYGYFKKEMHVDIAARNIAPYNNSFEALVKDLKKYKKNGYRVLLLSGSRTRARRLAEDLRNTEDAGLTAVYTEDPMREVQPGEILTYYGHVNKGFEYPWLKFVVLSESDIFGAEKRKKKKKKLYQGQKINDFNDLKIGDYVVHETHGLGIYKGIEKVEVDKVVKDYLKIEYRDGGNLYILATGLDVIQKYASADAAKKPKLNKLGGENGIGLVDMVENRLVGMKSRGVYETPGGAILYKAINVLETITLDKESSHFKAQLAQKYADIVYNGQWFTPLREALDAFADSLEKTVTGDVKLKLYKGNMINAGVTSPYTLYDEQTASFGEDDDYNQADSAGFINLFGLSIKERAKLSKNWPEIK